jgi:CheY-like chemotaxis protein
MAKVLIVSETPARPDALALELVGLGFEVEAFGTAAKARDRLNGPAPDAVVVEVSCPNSGMGMLVGQARAAWPGTIIVALTTFGDAQDSMLDQMGLWHPDLTLPSRTGAVRLARQLTHVLKNQNVLEESGEPS